MNKPLTLANLFFVLFSCVSFGMDNYEQYVKELDKLFKKIEEQRNTIKILSEVFYYQAPSMLQEIEAKKKSEEWKDVPSLNSENLLLLFRAGVIGIVDGQIVLKKQLKWNL